MTGYSPICATASTCSIAKAKREGPKMLSVGLHCRIVGRPARTAAVDRFQSHADVWITRRIDIAEHWRRTHPPAG